MKPNFRNFAFSFGSVLLLAAAGNAPADAANASDTERQVEGLWFYTGLATSDGVERPLTGVFLFKDGVFVQQAIFDAEPFEQQGAMAHSGPYQAHAGYVHLVAQQTLSTAPGTEAIYSSRGVTEHDVTVSREGPALTLVFDMGKGTVQRFEHVGPGEGEVHALKDGMLALVDGHVVLVQGDADGSVSGYGTYTRDGAELNVDAIRWTDASNSAVTNLRDQSLKLRIDGGKLTLPDGRAFEILE